MLVVGFAGCPTISTLNGEKTAHVLSELQSEYQLIRQLPGAEAKSNPYHASHKIRDALVSNYFQTTSSYRDIRMYYDSELSKHGWVFMREENVLYGEIFSRKDYGGKHCLYRKGEYRADLQYAGEQEAEFGWTYTINLRKLD